MSFKLSTPLLAALALTASFASLSASAADLPGKHPAYLHALTDLRAARWNLEHRAGDSAVSSQEDVAIVETDRAIGDAKTAAMEDGKNVYQHPPEDARIDRRGRLHHAAELLRKARKDVAEGESNPQAVELRNRVIGHIDNAIRATDHAIHDAEAGL